MSSTVRLPREIIQFLGLRGPQSLLVRGPPGSGKSTFCLAMLEAFMGTKILVTNRVSTPELNREYPWLGEEQTHGIQFIDTSAPDQYLVDGLRAASRSTEVLDVLKESPAERVALEEFLLLPPAIQEAWSQLPSNQPSLVVIDSWDALVEQYLGTTLHNSVSGIDRGEVERMLLRRMAPTRAHLILVLERSAESQLDYLTNGVVVTSRDESEGRLERWLRIPKLRGVRVADASYPYTVEGAKFQCIEPMRRYEEGRLGGFDPEPDPMPGFLWPGSQSLAEAFGRFPLGQATFLEKDENFPAPTVQRIIGPAMGHTMSHGGHVLLVPSPALTIANIWNSVSQAVPKTTIADTLRIVDTTGQLALSAKASHPELAPTILQPEALSPSEPNGLTESALVRKFLSGSVRDGFPNLVIVYLTGVAAADSIRHVGLRPEIFAMPPDSGQPTLGSARHHRIVIGAPFVSASYAASMRSFAAIHINLKMRQGRAFLYGSKPWTPGFVMTDAADGGAYHLLRVV
jgi:KaiC/GvpD/RAD55 family RecA-like ATPase